MIPNVLAIVSMLFGLCTMHQIFYLLVPHVLRRRKRTTEVQIAPHPVRSAVLVCARNEEAVIGELIASVRAQSSPAEVFVLADNCTDDTASVARAAGAVVWERFDSTRVGKGYALSALLSHMERAGYIFDRYYIFDADNLLDKDCLLAFARAFDEGYPIVTGYRSSKNFGENWISAGYGIFFLREARYLNHSRTLLGCGCAVSGTGFGFTRQVLEEQLAEGDPWPFHLMTEDLQFTAHHVLRGRKIGYTPEAVFYDEQPTGFVQSFHQRLRWSRGGLEVAVQYGGALLKKALCGSFTAWDMLMSSLPASLYNLFCVLLHTAWLITDGVMLGDISAPLLSVGRTVLFMGGMFFLLGFCTMLSERKRIPLSPGKKVLYTLTFPLFMFTYVPISLASYCCKVEWKPIRHRSKEYYVQNSDLR